MKDHFLDRIYGEYQAYKSSVLGLSGAEIFARCYEIDAMTNFYEILAERTECLSDDTIQKLLARKNILSELYDRWLKKDDSNYAEMENHISDEISNFLAEPAENMERGVA